MPNVSEDFFSVLSVFANTDSMGTATTAVSQLMFLHLNSFLLLRAN